MQSFFYKGPDRKYFRPYGPSCPCQLFNSAIVGKAAIDDMETNGCGNLERTDILKTFGLVIHEHGILSIYLVL